MLTFKKTDALIVIDIQNDFCPNGALAVPGGDEIIPVVNDLIDAFAEAGSPIVLTQDWHPAGHGSFASANGMQPFEDGVLNGVEQKFWPDHCVQGTRGAEFHPALRTNAASLIIRKGTDPTVDSYSAFFDNARKNTTGLAGWLRERGVDTCFFVGLALDYCVKFSALDAHSAGFTSIVVTDATRSIAPFDVARRSVADGTYIGLIKAANLI